MSIEIENKYDNSYDQNDYVIDVIDKITMLVRSQMKKGAIGGVRGLDNSIIKEVKDADSQLIDPKVVLKIKCSDRYGFLNENKNINVQSVLVSIGVL